MITPKAKLPMTSNKEIRPRLKVLENARYNDQIEQTIKTMVA